MVDLGSGIAIAGTAVSAAAVIITAIRSHATGIEASRSAITCVECGALKTKIEVLTQGLVRVEGRMDENFKEVFEVLRGKKL
jgi:hypothetical protein